MDDTDWSAGVHNSSRPFFPSVADVVAELSGTNEITTTFELSPSGPVHAGILRMLLYIRSVVKGLSQNSVKHRLVLRINDIAGLKNDRSKYDASPRRIASRAPGWCEAGQSALECLEQELRDISSRIGLHVDSTARVSQVYNDSDFQSLVSSIKPKISGVIEILKTARSTSVKLFSPACTQCNLVDVEIVECNSNLTEGRFVCRSCQNEELYDIAVSYGLITFKLELALMWKHFDVKIDYHGQDHAEAFEVARRIYVYLFDEAPPLPGRINLSQMNGVVVSKSRRNSPEISQLDDRTLNTLCDWISGRNFSNALNLGHFSWERM